MKRSERHKLRAGRAERRAATPLAGAVAGILFAVLFSLSVAIIETSMTKLPHDTGSWLDTGAGRFKFAIALIPFAGLFFLWFIAVARRCLRRDDRPVADRAPASLYSDRVAEAGGTVVGTPNS